MITFGFLYRAPLGPFRVKSGSEFTSLLELAENMVKMNRSIQDLTHSLQHCKDDLKWSGWKDPNTTLPELNAKIRFRHNFAARDGQFLDGNSWFSDGTDSTDLPDRWVEIKD